MIKQLALLLTVTTAFWGLTQSAEGDPVEVLSPEEMSKFRIRGDGTGVRFRILDVEHEEFGKAFEADLPARRPNSWDTQAQVEGLPRINEGDVVAVSFWLRGLRATSETGEATVGVVIEEGGTFEKVFEQDFYAGGDWTYFHIPLRAQRSVDRPLLNVRLGSQSQTVQLGGLRVVNHGGDADLASLPRTRFTYAGREADAEWRREALARIEKIRKGDMEIVVRDAEGNPVPGAEVRVQMKRHAFGWGVALEDRLFGTDEEYTRQVVENFNYLVPSNALKWNEWEGRPQEARRILEAIRETGLPMKAHAVVWPSWTGFEDGWGWAYVPRRIYDLRDDPAALRAAVRERAVEQSSTLGDSVDAYDVINEPYFHNDVMRVVGEDVMAEWFQIVHENAPNARLVLNEAITLDWGGGSDNLVRIVRDLKAAGAPVHAIGLQAHYGSGLTPPVTILRNLDRYHEETGLTIEITEFDMPGGDRELQADYLRDVMIALYSHPAVTHFVQWGHTDVAHWRAMDEAGLWDAEGKIKPAGQAYRDLVFCQFWTEEEGTTDEQGVFRVRGFVGDYEVEAREGERRGIAETSLKVGEDQVELVLLD